MTERIVRRAPASDADRLERQARMTERVVRRAPPDEVARLRRVVKMTMASARTSRMVAELRDRDRFELFLRRVFGQPD